MRIGAADPSLTATSGVAAVAEFIDKLDVVGRLDRGIGSIKKRERGASAGELLVGMAQSQLLGAMRWSGLDRQRGDVAAVELSAVPVLASTTAAGLARRFGPEHLAGVEAAMLTSWAFGSTCCQSSVGSALSAKCDAWTWIRPMWRFTGRRSRALPTTTKVNARAVPHLATWAEAGLTVAADLLAGNDDVRPRAADMLRRGLAGIPEPVRCRRRGVGPAPGPRRCRLLHR